MKKNSCDDSSSTNSLFGRPQDEDTICALSTPPGEGALALIRVSGRRAFAISRKLCPFLPKSPVSHHIYFGTLLSPVSGEALDEVLISCFKKGRSFTGEESVEISCHGGLFLSSVILEALVAAGARLAEKGEFSYRAFMNGRVDLVQAESILDLIQSRSPLAHKQALRGLKGKISDRLRNLEEKLLKLLSHLEASIDFSDQEIEPFSIKQQRDLLQETKREVEKGLKGFEQGRINREGFGVILLGATNAGKSSLFNYLGQADRAIVTKYPGTTRDILSARILINQREFCLKDTAGFRENPDLVEKKGIQKVLEEVSHSDLCLFLVESVLPLKERCFLGLDRLNLDKTVIVFSKSDQLSASERDLFLKEAGSYLKKKYCLVDGQGRSKDTASDLMLKSPASSSGFKPVFLSTLEKPIWLSSHTGEGVKSLKQLFYERSEKDVGDIFLSSSRQGISLEKVNCYLEQADKLLEQEASPELTAFELQSALTVLYELLGKEYNEEVIQQIFKEFCLGK